MVYRLAVTEFQNSGGMCTGFRLSVQGVQADWVKVRAILTPLHYLGPGVQVGMWGV